MAIQVTKDTGKYDRFKAKCKYCGKEITYGRNNVRPHRRWPNGFVYCPGCKRPIGHEESNLEISGEELLKQSAIAQNVDADKLERQIRKLRVPKIVLLAVGIPVLVIGAVLFTISLTGMFGGSWILRLIFFLVFNIGLSMVITGGVFARLINHKQEMIQSL